MNLCVGDRISLGFVWAEIDLISLWGIKIDLISVHGSELTWFLRGGRKILGFSVWIEINLVLCRSTKIDHFRVGDRT